MSVRVPAVAAVLLVALLPGLAAAQQPALDAEASVPYLWRVVVQARPHPLLSPAFRDQLRRDLLAALQPGIGPLGSVEVIDLAAIPRDAWDPLWQQFDDKGFAALDAPRDLTGVKTHFLRVEVRDGAFHLEARQHDGFTGLASPLVRRQSTRAAELVGRVAGMLIERDFGLAGTLEAGANKDEVQVRFKAGQLGSLDRFVKPGDVLALSQITKTSRPAPEPARTATGKVIAPPPGATPPPALSPTPLDFTLLKVAEVKDGAAKCTVLTRYQTALPARTRSGAAVAGYRCLRLTTVAATVTVKLASGDGTTPAIPVANVRASDAGFTDRPNPRDFLDFREGVYRSNKPLSNVACVTVAVGETRSERFPVPVLGTDPVTLRFEVDAKAEEKANFERAVLAVASRVADARSAQEGCFRDVAKLILDVKNAEALARARGGFKAAEVADKVLAEEVEQLKGQLGKSPGAKNLLDSVEHQLAAMRAANAQLGVRVKELEAIVAKADDPSSVARQVQAEALNTRIKLLLERGEVDEALAAFDQLATLVPESPEVKARKEKLAAEWKPKDDEHAKARLYLTRTWPALATAQDLKDSLPTLRTAVDACKKAGDRFAFRKLLTVLGGFPAKLNELTKDLDPNADADRKVLEDVRAVRDFVTKLETELTDYLKANPQ